MNAAVEEMSVAGIQDEWARVELLAICLLESRRGREPSAEQIKELRRLQLQVDHLRSGERSPWRRLFQEPVPPLMLDVLACVFASEARPAVGWLYQELQPGSPKPYVTPALLHVLLAMGEQEAHDLQPLVGTHGLLQRHGLIECDDDSAFLPLKPVKEAVAALMAWPRVERVPPGSSRVRQTAGWDELVLPADRIQMLHEYLYWVRHRDTVVGEWGGKSLGGPVALFSGPSGTGKTFAAGVIAADLGWPLYRVDLSRLVSKYIGETEKNLGRLFDAAHGRPLVLQFDEADALLGKRGEVKDARDRYANMEVSYLLSRIEDHNGPCILTSNLRSQMDSAFIRRFQMVVEFPRPDQDARAALWERMLPQRAPVSDEVDVQFLARSVNMTGGNIRNAALHAAYLAADAERAIDLSHIATAVWRELAKGQAQVNKQSMGELVNHVPQGVIL